MQSECPSSTSSEIASSPCPNCCLCGAEGVFVHRDVPDRLYGVPGKWSLRQCPNCGLAWLDPMPLQEDIHRAYQTYYTHDAAESAQSLPRRILRMAEDGYLRRGYAYKLAASSLLSPLVHLHPSGRSVAECSVAYLRAPEPGSRFLDIGCGSGALAARMRDLGWDAEGIDHDPSAVDAARSRGLAVRVGDIRQQGYPDASYDAICAKHVIEHVHDPASFLAECYRILRPGGKLVLITPNLNSKGHRTFGEFWLHLDPPRHIFMWQPGSLRKAVESQGFACERVFTSPRYADDAWSRSHEIQTRGHTDLSSGFGRASRLRGLAFLLGERALLRFNKQIGEEIVLIASK